jgi:hypothetical protein
MYLGEILVCDPKKSHKKELTGWFCRTAKKWNFSKKNDNKMKLCQAKRQIKKKFDCQDPFTKICEINSF